MDEDDKINYMRYFNSFRGVVARIKAAIFWTLAGICIAACIMLYTGPSRIVWDSQSGIVIEIGYDKKIENELEKYKNMVDK